MGDIPGKRDRAENMEEEPGIHGQCRTGTLRVGPRAPPTKPQGLLTVSLPHSTTQAFIPVRTPAHSQTLSSWLQRRGMSNREAFPPKETSRHLNQL